MPVPMTMARVNKRVFNPMEIRKGKRPVLIHTGRVSGMSFETPMDAHPVDGGFIVVVMYGTKSDWVRNVLAAGSASLRIGEDLYELSNPTLLGRDDALAQLSEGFKQPPGWLNVSDYLKLEVV